MRDNRKQCNPWRLGQCDYIFNRPCESPWKDEGRKKWKASALYVQGYLEAKERGIQFQPTTTETTNTTKENPNHA